MKEGCIDDEGESQQVAAANTGVHSPVQEDDVIRTDPPGMSASVSQVSHNERRIEEASDHVPCDRDAAYGSQCTSLQDSGLQDSGLAYWWVESSAQPASAYTSAIARNSLGLRLAPPTSAPSTLATDISSLAFDGFTEPP